MFAIDTIFLSDVRFVVFDEADTLFEEGFIEDLRPIIGAVKRKETEDRKNQFISVSATLPKHVVKTIDSFFPVSIFFFLFFFFFFSLLNNKSIN